MKTDLINKFYGVLFGQAIGDALGFAAEFLSRSQVRFIFPQGLTHYS
jgi:ADP-ribosylglycohydrolase